MATFGELLAELRMEHKLSQKQLGDLIFVSSGTISNYENGVHYPDVERLIRLADYFDVTVDYLLGRCVSDLSVAVLNEELVQGQTVGEVVEHMQELTIDQRQALLAILHDMHFAAIVGRYNRGEV